MLWDLKTKLTPKASRWHLNRQSWSGWSLLYGAAAVTATSYVAGAALGAGGAFYAL